MSSHTRRVSGWPFSSVTICWLPCTPPSPPKKGSGLLTETLSMLRASGSSDVASRAAESLLLMHLGLQYTGVGQKESARHVLEEAEVYAKIIHQREPEA